MGAFGDVGGVLIGKQSDGSATSINTPNINMTVMKMDQNAGLYLLALVVQLEFQTVQQLLVNDNPILQIETPSEVWAFNGSSTIGSIEPICQ